MYGQKHIIFQVKPDLGVQWHTPSNSVHYKQKLDKKYRTTISKYKKVDKKIQKHNFKIWIAMH